MRIADLIRRIEKTAPPRHAAGWDNCGPQIAGTASSCSRLAVALDPLPEIVEEALAWGAECILTHHPLLLAPRLPDRLDDYHRVLSLVLGKGAWLYAAHTSLDVQAKGPVSHLAESLGLQDRRVIEPVKTARAVMLRLGLASAEARDAAVSRLSGIPEVLSVEPSGARSLDVACFDEDRDAVFSACGGPDGESPRVLSARLESPSRDIGFGLVGNLPEPMPFSAFAGLLAGAVERDFWTLAGTVPETVARVGYCTGSGADLAPAAFAMGADVYLTGDVKHHQALSLGGLVIDLGHFRLEETMMRVFADELRAELAPRGLEVKYFDGGDPFSVYRPGR